MKLFCAFSFGFSLDFKLNFEMEEEKNILRKVHISCLTYFMHAQRTPRHRYPDKNLSFHVSTISVLGSQHVASHKIGFREVN